jgi:hypothetical protein
VHYAALWQNAACWHNEQRNNNAYTLATGNQGTSDLVLEGSICEVPCWQLQTIAQTQKRKANCWQACSTIAQPSLNHCSTIAQPQQTKAKCGKACSKLSCLGGGGGGNTRAGVRGQCGGHFLPLSSVAGSGHAPEHEAAVAMLAGQAQQLTGSVTATMLLAVHLAGQRTTV